MPEIHAALSGLSTHEWPLAICVAKYSSSMSLLFYFQLVCLLVVQCYEFHCDALYLFPPVFGPVFMLCTNVYV